MDNVLTVTLPWPAPELSPNKCNRWAKIEAVTAARNVAYLAAFDACVEMPCGVPLEIVLDFYPPDRHHFDLDNLIARCKAYLDGIFIACHSDDHAVMRIIASRHQPDKFAWNGGGVMVRIRGAA